MLVQLSIKNYILIDKLHLDFGKGLNIITGETGAGKSIILGALGLILGNRADTKALYNPEKKCIIEGVLDISAYNLRDFFDENEWDYESLTIIRREIQSSGKSRAFVNDTPANLKQLNELTRRLIDLHEQWDTLEIRESSHQLYLLDLLADNGELLHEFNQLFRHYQDEISVLDNLNSENIESKREFEFVKFQVGELEKANLKSGELEETERNLEQLENLEEIKSVLQTGVLQLDDESRGALTILRQFAKELRQIHHLDPFFEKLLERLDNIIEETTDIQKDAETALEKYVQSDGNINEVEARVNLLHSLLNKHHAGTEEELIEIRDEFMDKLYRYESLDSLIQEKTVQIENLLKQLKSKGEELHEKRLSVIPEFQKHVQETLTSLAMPFARLEIQLTSTGEPGPKGWDKVEFSFAANKGTQLQPLKNVASGGEISRFNLSVKSLIADKASLPSLVFDEIDSGLSGEVALRVGQILQKLAKDHQIISITHSPQVAARADRHFLVYKGHHQSHSQTKIEVLDEENRILEIAKMLSGDPPKPAAIENAKQLINH